MSSALDLVGKSYRGMAGSGYSEEPVILGATYLIFRDYEDAQVVVARSRSTTNRNYVVRGLTTYRSTLVDPPVVEGDRIIALEQPDGGGLRRDLIRTVMEVRDDGIMAKYVDDAEPKLFTHWVLWGGGRNDVKDKYNPRRRELVLQRLTDEGMRRAYENGYAQSAREFFDKFNLPKPAVEPVAFINAERKVTWRDMDYDMRRMFERGGVDSLRTAVLSGRIKVTLDKQECRCAEITEEEVNKKFIKNHNGDWTVGGLHKVECMWCTKSGSMPGADEGN